MEKELRWSVDRNRLGSHFLLKPGEEEENLFIPPRTVDPQRPMIALTFDDGPHPRNTPRILETLKTYDGASTFFMVGTNVERYPDVVLQVAENGSEIASHTYNHPNLTRLSADSLNVQLNRVSELVNDLTHQQIQIQTLRSALWRSRRTSERGFPNAIDSLEPGYLGLENPQRRKNGGSCSPVRLRMVILS